jgi:hypothetical protein
MKQAIKKGIHEAIQLLGKKRLIQKHLLKKIFLLL